MDSQTNPNRREPEDEGHAEHEDELRLEPVAPVPIRDEKTYHGEAFATAGEWLSTRRRALGLTLEDASLATRVRQDYLAAIEDMDPRRMPQGPYAPGFVRTYAIFLELDPESVSERFREEMSPRRLRTPHAAPPPSPVRLDAPPPQLGALLVGLLALVGFSALVWRALDRADEVHVPPVPRELADRVAAEVQVPRTSAAPELIVGPELSLRARVPVWVEARAPDGGTLISRTLEAGEEWSVPRIRGILVSTDNGAAVEALLDGRVSQRLGEPGLPVTGWRADDVRGIVLPPEPPPVPVEEIVGDIAGEPLESEEAPSLDAGADADDLADAEALDDSIAEDPLVTPELPSESEITVESLPPLSLSQDSVADAAETAASEGRVVDPGADAPDVE